MFFQVIYLVLLIGSRSYTFLFYLTFSIFKNLGVTVICFGLEKVFFTWDCPCFVLFIIVDWNAKGGRKENTWSNRKIWPWSTEWSRAKANRVLPREHTGHSKHLLPTTQEKTLHMDITSWSTSKSDRLYALQPKMKTL